MLDGQKIPDLFKPCYSIMELLSIVTFNQSLAVKYRFFFLQLLLRDFLKGKGRKDSANTFLFFFNEEFLSIQIKSKKGRKRRSS